MSELLTDAELAALQVEVQKEIDKELKAKARTEAKEKLLQQARHERGLSKPVEEVLIDLPPDGNQIRINNRDYSQGHWYTVTADVAIMLRDTMQRAWEHQAQIEGRSKDHFRRQRMTHVGHGGVRNSPQTPGGLRV